MNAAHEQQLCAAFSKGELRYVIGVDEAGRGPLFGPVCVAAVCVAVTAAGARVCRPADAAARKGGRREHHGRNDDDDDDDGEVARHAVFHHRLLNDSKLMSDTARQQLVAEVLDAHFADELLRCAAAGHSVASVCPCLPPPSSLSPAVGSGQATGSIVGIALEFVSSTEIDRVNILNATLQGMHTAVATLVARLSAESERPLECPETPSPSNTALLFDGPHLPHQLRPLAPATAAAAARSRGETAASKRKARSAAAAAASIPATAPPSPLAHFAVHAVVRGDSRCPSVALASVFAKLARDAHITALDAAFPQYGLAQHKGYGTARHLAALKAHGPSEHHRRSFAPVRAVLPPPREVAFADSAAAADDGGGCAAASPRNRGRRRAARKAPAVTAKTKTKAKKAVAAKRSAHRPPRNLRGGRR